MRSPTGCLFLAAVLFPDLSPATRDLLARMGVPAERFPVYLQEVNAETAERERQGENDHLIFYVLQSRRFTDAPPVEPALSAAEYHRTSLIPAAVQKRFHDFLSAPVQGERMSYLRGLPPSTQSAPAFLAAEYARSMRSLYEKEFEHSADFYAKRGHSTDTQIPANYGVWTALSILHAAERQFRPARVLVVGPGLDFAPRTALDERFPPQSYQPYAIADALLSLDVSPRPQIHCVDINSRVLRFFEDLPRRPQPILHLFTPPGDPDYLAYFKTLGSSVGAVQAVSALEKTVQLNEPTVRSVTAERLNIVTERLAATYDLIVATNILVYFDKAELLLALANIQSMLAPTGVFIHNDLRPQIDVFSQAAGLQPIQARTIRIASGAKAPLYDAFAIYRRSP